MPEEDQQFQKKTVSSAGAKFNLLAEEKLELVKLQKEIANKKMAQDQREHEMKMEILSIKKENEKLKQQILSEGQLVLKI